MKLQIYVNLYNIYSICKIEVNPKRITISHREVEDGNEIIKAFKIQMKKLKCNNYYFINMKHYQYKMEKVCFLPLMKPEPKSSSSSSSFETETWAF